MQRSQYNRLGDSEGVNSAPRPVSTRRASSQAGPSGNVKVMFGLSICGIIFLSTICYMLNTESEYLRVSTEEAGGGPKSTLAQGVGGAIALYFCVLIYTGKQIYFPGSGETDTTN